MPRGSPYSRVSRRGFTLLETALATIIVGVGLVATMQLFAASTEQNNSGARMTTAMLLASNVQEALATLSFADPVTGTATFGPEETSVASYDDVDDFNNYTFNPPIDAQRQPLADLAQYSQKITVTRVSPSNLNTTSGSTTGAVRIQVDVLFAAKSTDTPVQVYSMCWIRMAS